MDTTLQNTGHIVLEMDEADLKAMVRERAYELSQIRRGLALERSPEEDWYQAVAEIEPFVAVEHSN